MAGIDYARHIWEEKVIQSVANVTQHDLCAFLRVAAEIPLKPEVQTWPLEEASLALRALKEGHPRGVYFFEIF